MGLLQTRPPAPQQVPLTCARQGRKVGSGGLSQRWKIPPGRDPACAQARPQSAGFDPDRRVLHRCLNRPPQAPEPHSVCNSGRSSYGRRRCSRYLRILGKWNLLESVLDRSTGVLGTVSTMKAQSKSAWLIFGIAAAVAAAGFACAVIAAASAYTDPALSTAFGRAAGVLVSATVVYLAFVVFRRRQASHS
jgi:hypothetical protein